MGDVAAAETCMNRSAPARNASTFLSSTAPAGLLCRPAGRGFRRPSKAPRVRRSNRFTLFISHQTESHFAVAAKNVKQHFHLKILRAVSLLKVLAASF
jgi:hypothetical protein